MQQQHLQWIQGELLSCVFFQKFLLWSSLTQLWACIKLTTSVTSDIHKTDRIRIHTMSWYGIGDGIFECEFRGWIMWYTCSTLIYFLYFATEEGPFWGWNVLLYWTRLPPDSRFKILSPTPCYEYLSLLHLIGQQQPRSWRTKAWLLWRTCRSHLRSWTTINGLESGMDTDSMCTVCKDVTYALYVSWG